MNFSADFGPFEERTWINCAHQGALPRVAANEAREAVKWKSAPHQLTDERFSNVPHRLKKALGSLIGASANDIILGNSASYGLHLLANGIKWKAGDEVLLVKGDFPSDLLPWLVLEKQGVHIRYIEPQNHLLTLNELEANITDNTRLFCTTWVHSFSGVAADISALGELCQTHGITFVVNASQALGARPMDVSDVAVDALIGVGFKWLCGPYGTGFCWMHQELLQSLDYNQAYWLAEMTAEELGNESGEIQRPKGPPTAKTFDVFATANFFNFKPWRTSIEYLLEQGIDRIAEHDQQLVSQFIDGLNTKKYKLLSPREGPERSTLIFVSHRKTQLNNEIHSLLKHEGIDIAFRREKLRFAPHLYNTKNDIEKALSVLDSV